MMTEDELLRFMELFRIYRDEGELPPDEREEFKCLAEKHKNTQRERDDSCP